MDTIKRFFKYAIWIILFYILTEGLIYIGTKNRFKQNTDIYVNTKSPIIQVSEVKSSYTNGYIEGNITNDTGEHIKQCYLKIDFYNKNQNYLGTEYKELEYFNVNETINFEIYYEYTGVKSAVFSIVNKKDTTSNLIELNGEYKEYEKLWPIVGIFTLLYAI